MFPDTNLTTGKLDVERGLYSFCKDDDNADAVFEDRVVLATIFFKLDARVAVVDDGREDVDDDKFIEVGDDVIVEALTNVSITPSINVKWKESQAIQRLCFVYIVERAGQTETLG